MTEEQLAATLAVVVTPQRLYAELNARRKELGWPWWRVAVALDVSVSALNRMRHGAHIQGIRERAPEWLERLDRRPAQPRPE
ncbi:hypothetical protein OIE13_06095 [Streptosporangium sp. NBC_01810]|uniref:hypothetical protein n=1 Tax=Streptosporangium sp. NBC_01810 TaxID=2975951 RepID=UPI002DDA1FF4|nr:hypothetical protein [Streptosporangium sp. NBC_01810]WSA27445.1 hypothetical protein OIE13_06095 [Streptosporangium sp. NBC_01810]